jgi:hypothetical protein
MPTVFGRNLVALPSTPAAPASLQFSPIDLVAVSTAIFTGQQQLQDWQAAYLEAVATYPPMTHVQAQSWIAFLLALRGQLGVFQLADPLAMVPQGTALGSPQVNGSLQTGFSLLTKGWAPSSSGLLQPGDFLQIGYRLYRNLAPLNSDGAGHATASIWPQLRESPTDGDSIVTSATQGLWCLKSNTRSWSVDDMRTYGFQLEIREAI